MAGLICQHQGEHTRGLSSRKGWAYVHLARRWLSCGVWVALLQTPCQAQAVALWLRVTGKKFAGGFPANSHKLSVQVDINLAERS